MPKRRTVEPFYGKMEQRMDQKIKDLPVEHGSRLRKKLAARLRAKRERALRRGY